MPINTLQTAQLKLSSNNYFKHSINDSNMQNCDPGCCSVDNTVNNTNIIVHVTVWSIFNYR